jgi:hypothetical protein
MNYKDKTVRIFNKFFSGFLKDLKEIDDDLKKSVKASYKFIDKASHEYCEFFVENFMIDGNVSKHDVTLESLGERMVCQNIKLADVITKTTENSKNVVFNYVYILSLFAHMYKLEDENELLEQVLKLVSAIQNGSEEYEQEKDDVIDDDIKALLEKIKEYGGQTKVNIDASGSTDSFDPSKILDSLNNSKIANLAKEISKDIDLSGIKTDNPDDLIKNMFNMSGENNVLGNIIQKVSSTLNEKISTGEFKQEDLIGEAMNMMNMFSGSGVPNPFTSNPLFNQMMKSMKTGKTNIKQDVVKKADTRERLRRKLEMRKKNVD